MSMSVPGAFRLSGACRAGEGGSLSRKAGIVGFSASGVRRPGRLRPRSGTFPAPLLPKSWPCFGSGGSIITPVAGKGTRLSPCGRRSNEREHAGGPVSRAPGQGLASVGPLKAEAAGRVLAAAADLSLTIDESGIVRGCAFRSDDLARAVRGGVDWPGQAWTDLLTVESRPKAQSLLRSALRGEASPPCHLNHPAAQPGPDVAIEYTAVRVGRTVLAFGCDLRDLSALQQRLVDAQQALEHEHATLRRAEARYRVLFAATPEPLLLLDGASLRIRELNPAAEAMFDRGRRAAAFHDCVHAEDRASAQRFLAGVAANGAGGTLAARLNAAPGADGQAEPLPVLLVAEPLVEEGRGVILLRLRLEPGSAPTAEEARLLLLAAAEHSPDAQILLDPGGRLLAANNAFLAMAQLPGLARARGEPLETWVGRSGVDTEVLLANIRQRRNVRLFPTLLRGAQGVRMDVEISGNAFEAGGQTLFALALRDVGRRLPVQAGAAAEGAPAIARSVEQLTELIGRVSLKELVRDATDVIERLCIESALELTNNNRASAAEILGMSRQNLYLKLRRFGLGADGEDEDAS